MKRICAILLCLVLLLAGCSKQPASQEAPETIAPTEAPVAAEPPAEAPTEPAETEPPMPETVSGTALLDKATIVLQTANRDEVLDIVGEFDDQYYAVKLENGYGLIEKTLVRMDGEAAYESWDGYARYKAKFYSSYHLNDAEPESLSMNANLTVLDAFGDRLVVQYGEKLGYMLEADVSRYYIQPSSGGSSSGADGGDISLGSLSTIVPQAGDVTGAGKVLVNDAQIILGWFDRDEAMEIVTEEGFAESKEGYYTVYLNGLYGYVLQAYVLKDGDAPFENWDGYAQRNAPVYDNYYLSGEPITKLSSNTEIQILLDLGNCYMVSYGDTVGYMAKDTVSDSYIHYSSGGSSGGGEWTPPAL